MPPESRCMFQLEGAQASPVLATLEQASVPAVINTCPAAPCASCYAQCHASMDVRLNTCKTVRTHANRTCVFVVTAVGNRYLSSNISYFGVGSKNAAFYLGNTVKVVTRQAGAAFVHELCIQGGCAAVEQQRKLPPGIECHGVDTKQGRFAMRGWWKAAPSVQQSIAAHSLQWAMSECCCCAAPVTRQGAGATLSRRRGCV